MIGTCIAPFLFIVTGVSTLKKIVRWLVVLLVIGLLYVFWQYLSVARFGAQIGPVQSDVIIVLGAEVRGDQPSPALAERCDWAYQIYKEGYAPKLILSGAKGNGRISEAEAMRRYLLKKGVPDDAMLLEENSRTTRENLANSKAIMAEHGMKTAIIATHLFHQKRAQFLARELEMQTSGYGQKSSTMFEPYWTLRETASLVKAYLGL